MTRNSIFFLISQIRLLEGVFALWGKNKHAFHRRSPSSLTFPTDFSPFPCVSSQRNGSSTLQQCFESTASLQWWVWHSLMLIIHALCVVCFARVCKPDLYSCSVWLAVSATYMFPKLCFFVCKWSSLLKIGKTLPSRFVVSINKCIEVFPLSFRLGLVPRDYCMKCGI